MPHSCVGIVLSSGIVNNNFFYIWHQAMSISHTKQFSKLDDDQNGIPNRMDTTNHWALCIDVTKQ